MTRTLIRGGTVVSMEAQVGIVPDCDLLVENGAIAAMGPDLAVEDADIIDARHAIVAPGFVDTHRHLWETAIRGVLPTCSLNGYFETVIGGYAPKFRAEDVYAGNLVGAYEALNAGVTTVVDWCHCINSPAHADAAIAALRETGIRSSRSTSPPTVGG